MSSEIMTVSQAQIDAAMERARELRAEYMASYAKGAFVWVKESAARVAYTFSIPRTEQL